MNINFKGETFDLACHHVEIEEYDEVVILWLNKYPNILLLNLTFMHYNLHTPHHKHK